MTTAKQIATEVARKHGVAVSFLIGPNKKKERLSIRNEALHEIRSQLGWSYNRIGEMFGLDHKTVMGGVYSYRNGQGPDVTPDMESDRRERLDRIWAKVKEAME